MIPRMEVHSHTHYSNLRLIDCINKPKDLVDKAIEIGLKGICITDHECLSPSIELNIYQKKIQEKYPDFKVGTLSTPLSVYEFIQATEDNSLNCRCPSASFAIAIK